MCYARICRIWYKDTSMYMVAMQDVNVLIVVEQVDGSNCIAHKAHCKVS